MSSSETLGTGESGAVGEEWFRVLGTYDQVDGTYVACEATETGVQFAVPEKTGFDFIDNPSEQQNEI